MYRQVPLILVALLIVVGCSSSDPTADVEANEAAHLDAFFTEDIDALLATFTDDAVFVDETFGDFIEGKTQLRSFYEIVFRISDPERTEVLDSFVSSDATRATSVWEWRGVSASGNPFDLSNVLIHEYRDGLISKQSIYYASRDAYEQLASP